MNTLTKIMALLFLIVNLTFCKKESIKKEIEVKEVIKEEKFENFKKQFFADSIFQKSRIKFPVKNILNDVDYGQKIEEIKISDWSFLNIYKPEYIINFEHKQKTVSLIIQINDTGIYVIYRFNKIDGMWYLTEIEDQST